MVAHVREMDDLALPQVNARWQEPLHELITTQSVVAAQLAHVIAMHVAPLVKAGHVLGYANADAEIIIQAAPDADVLHTRAHALMELKGRYFGTRVARTSQPMLDRHIPLPPARWILAQRVNLGALKNGGHKRVVRIRQDHGMFWITLLDVD